MAHYFEYATKDTTLYERSGSQNAGLDEILEIAKDVSPANRLYGVSRALIKFDLTYISSSYSAGTFGNNPKFYLNLFDANTRGIQSTQTLFAYAVTQSWENGYGRSDSNPRIGEGASWNFRDSDTLKTQWTGSMTASGGHWNTLYSASQVFDQEAADMRMDVTNLVLLQLSGSANGGVENEGFIIKREGNVGNSDTTTAEGSGTPLGTFSFFSRETHTIYQPKLEVVWNDSKWVTGSLSALTSEDLEDLVLYARGLKKQYREDSDDAFADHVDVGDYNSARRFLVCFLYLNDVEEGGTTDFPKIHHAITPKCARILVFPPNWMYRHAGRPVTKGTKYILGSYLHYL